MNGDWVTVDQLLQSERKESEKTCTVDYIRVLTNGRENLEDGFQIGCFTFLLSSTLRDRCDGFNQ